MNLLLALAAASLLPAQDPATRTWDVGGVKREALVHAPTKKPAGKTPVVFDFHGHGGTARHASKAHRLHEVWPEALVVYPQGLKTPGKLTDPEGKKTGWQSTPGDQVDRDLKFFDAMLATLQKGDSLDDRRVYVTGHSNGGAFSYLLWTKRGDDVAAVAPVAAAAGLYFLKAGPKPLFHVIGKKDPLVKPAMQERTIAAAKKVNGCEGEGLKWAEGCLKYASKKGAPVVVYTHDGGHEYPKGTAELIVKFFKEQGGGK